MKQPKTLLLAERLFRSLGCCRGAIATLRMIVAGVQSRSSSPGSPWSGHETNAGAHSALPNRDDNHPTASTPQELQPQSNAGLSTRTSAAARVCLSPLQTLRTTRPPGISLHQQKSLASQILPMPNNLVDQRHLAARPRCECKTSITRDNL